MASSPQRAYAVNAPYLTDSQPPIGTHPDADHDMAEVVLHEILPELHPEAAPESPGEPCFAPVSRTGLIHQVWLKSVGKGGWQANSRNHFYAIASLAMRRAVVDCARTRLAQRRPDRPSSGDNPATVQNAQPAETHPLTLVQLGVLMDRLERSHPEIARIVDMHYFAGFTLKEISEQCGLSPWQVEHYWEKGRYWLKDRLGSPIG